MSFRKVYHAISSTNIDSFNKVLNEHTDNGYTPLGSISVTSAPLTNRLETTYALLLMKTTKTDD